MERWGGGGDDHLCVLSILNYIPNCTVFFFQNVNFSYKLPQKDADDKKIHSTYNIAPACSRFNLVQVSTLTNWPPADLNSIYFIQWSAWTLKKI